MEGGVQIRGLVKRFGGANEAVAIDGLDIEIHEGEFLVLLGASGCGKTTTLRCLAGLEAGDAGTITMRGESVFDAERGINRPPDKRNIGMVFQAYALWPHMTVRKNLAYPLKARRLRQGLEDGWVEDIARLVQCEHLLDRYPGQLSGGQQQRVALARGLVSRPDLILFDEPLSNLDAKLRKSVRAELHLLHRRLRFTAVYVTHDQEEAFALGDRIVIMRDGRIEQVGQPTEVYRRPVTEYVADFIGMSNSLALDREGTGWVLGGRPVNGAGLAAPPSDSGPLRVRLRPEDVQVIMPGDEPLRSEVMLDGLFVDAAFAGGWIDALIDVGDSRMTVHVAASDRSEELLEAAAGTAIRIGFRWSNAAVFDDTGTRVDVRGPARPFVAQEAGRDAPRACVKEEG